MEVTSDEEDVRNELENSSEKEGIAEEDTRFHCFECSCVFETSVEFHSHIRNHERHICPECGILISKSNMRKHLDICNKVIGEYFGKQM